MKRLQPDKLEPKSEKCVFIGYPKETVGYTFCHRSEGKVFVAKNGSFLEKEFLSKDVSGRKVELDANLFLRCRVAQNWKMFQSSLRHLEHHSVMVCPNIVIVLY